MTLPGCPRRRARPPRRFDCSLLSRRSPSSSRFVFLFPVLEEFRHPTSPHGENKHTGTGQSVAGALSDAELIKAEAYRESPMNLRAHPLAVGCSAAITAGWGRKRRKLRLRYVWASFFLPFRMDRYGFGHAPLLRDTAADWHGGRVASSADRLFISPS